MRLLLTAAIFILHARQSNAIASSPFKLPSGFPDGTLITVYFLHKGNGYTNNRVEEWAKSDPPEEVRLRFFDQDFVSEPDQRPFDMIEIIADREIFFQLIGDYHKHVGSDTNVAGEWKNAHRVQQIVDRVIPSNGHWKIEVYKLDDSHLLVFFDDYVSGVRPFDRSLGGAHSFYLVSDHVEHSTIQVSVKLPQESVLPPVTVQYFDERFNQNKFPSELLYTFSEWPVGEFIEISAVMRVSGDAALRLPSLIFAGTDGEPFLMVIQIRRKPYEHAETWFTSKKIPKKVIEWSQKSYAKFENFKPSAEQVRDRCVWFLDSSHIKHNGDIHHMRLERITKNTVSIKSFYKYPNGYTGVECHRTTDWIVPYLDGDFVINGVDGAVVLHMSTSIPHYSGWK